MKKYPEIPVLQPNLSLSGRAKLVPNVTYSDLSGQTLDLLLPWDTDAPGINAAAKPLIVFIQGSAWTVPDRNFEIPQLSAYARRGYVVATVGHRNTQDGYRFPTFLNDVKNAIRFLRENADLYKIDPTRVIVWGTSSGGNAALLVGLTGDDPEYRDGEHEAFSDRVSAVVSCFSPCDTRATVWPARHSEGFHPTMVGAFGRDESRWDALVDRYSPIHLVQPGRDYPPFLLMHGSGDSVVSFS